MPGTAYPPVQMAGEEDDVIVVDCRGNMQTGCLGGMLMTALATKGCAGLVVDGCVRDLPEAMELGPNATKPYPPRFYRVNIAFKSDVFLPRQAKDRHGETVAGLLRLNEPQAGRTTFLCLSEVERHTTPDTTRCTPGRSTSL